MILGDPNISAAEGAYGLGRITVNELFHYAVRRRPDALALADPANRSDIVGGKPRRLSYAAADRAIAAIAARLRGMGLPTDAVVGIQLPNVVENVLTMLAVLRAGMIAAPLPLLWRRADAVTALARVGAKALITCGRIGANDHGQFARQAAAEVFSIRYVCAFGSNLPDGVVSFEDLLSEQPSGHLLPLDRARDNAGRACRCRHLRREQKGNGAGRSYPFRTFRRRACGHSRKPAGAGGQYSFGAVACLVRGSKPHNSALAV